MFGVAPGPFISSTFGIFIVFFLVIAAIMSIFIPFWIFRIRNEAIAANRSLERIAKLLASQSPSTSLQAADQPKYKLCPECGHQNAADSTTCASCRQRME